MPRAAIKKREAKLGVFFLLLSVVLAFGTAAVSRGDVPEENVSDVTTLSGISGEERFFGYSEQGREIDGYVFGTGDDRLFFVAGLHGNEKGAAVLLERLAEEIMANPTLVAPGKQVIILPIANPDGYYGRKDKLNANNVNLNRNFSTKKWTPYEEGIFGGFQPFSQKESVAVKNVAVAYQPNMLIAFHSQGALTVPEITDEGSIALAQWYAEKTGYTYFDDWDYSGTATGWFMETTGNPAITVELTSHSESDWEINKPALLELLGQVK